MAVAFVDDRDSGRIGHDDEMLVAQRFLGPHGGTKTGPSFVLVTDRG